MQFPGMLLTCVLVVLTCGASADMEGHAMIVDTHRGQHRSARSAVKDAGPPEMTSLRIESDILYRYAKTSVASELANKADVAREITFSAVLPESAFVSAFHIELDGQLYHAYVKEKQAAHEEYSEAVNQGRTAGKLYYTTRDSDRFTVSVNVEANTKITFNLTYEELLTRRLEVYSDVINIDPGQIVPDLSVVVRVQELTDLTTFRVPSLRATNEISQQVNGVPNDPIAVIERPSGNRATVTWKPSVGQQKDLNDDGIRGQLVVEYDVARQDNPAQILVSGRYFVHFCSLSGLTPLNKHMVFVLDVSKSMEGNKIQQMRQAMQTILNHLEPNDHFSILLFATDVKAWHPLQGEVIMPAAVGLDALSPQLIVQATDDNVLLAKEFVDKIVETSATNIYDALMASLTIVKLGQIQFKPASNNKTPGRGGKVPEPIIVFLTDGQPNRGESNLENILRDVTAKNKRGNPIFSLAFGGDADKEFLRRLAAMNSGFSRMIYEASDSALQLSQFYRQVEAPVLAIAAFHYEPNEVISDTLTNLKFNTVFRGSELVVAGEMAAGTDHLKSTLIAKSIAGKKKKVGCDAPTVVNLPVADGQPNIIEKMWANLNIRQLLEAQDVPVDGAVTSKDRALALALKYSFLTPLTSLVVAKPNSAPPVYVDPKTAASNTGADASPGSAGWVPLKPAQKIKAQKFMDQAKNALSYDDVPTAIVNVKKLLTLLETGVVS